MDQAQHVVIVGSVALDSVETLAEGRSDLLGGSASFFATAASFLSPVRLVAVVGEDFPEEHVAFLEGRGVDLGGLARAPGRTFRWSGRYSRDFNRRTTLDTQLNVFADFHPELPARFRSSELLFLGNIDPALQLEVLEQVQRPRLIAMDTMNFWIESRREVLLEVIRRVDFLLLNDEEAHLLGQTHGLLQAARRIREMGVPNVIIKRGDAGALLFHEDQIFAVPAMPLAEVVDPTGAGDAFAGGFMGHLARVGAGGLRSGMALRQAMVCGSAMASFCCEAFSLDRLRDLTLAEIHARTRAFLDLTHFEDLSLA